MSFCGVTVTANKLANLPIRTEESNSRSTVCYRSQRAAPSSRARALVRHTEPAHMSELDYDSGSEGAAGFGFGDNKSSGDEFEASYDGSDVGSVVEV